MSTMNRRQLLALLGSAGASAYLEVPGYASAQPSDAPEDFDFSFFTDTHLQPELSANAGCAMAFSRMPSHKVDFAIQGGDHIFDGLGVPKQRSLSLFEMYDRTQQDLSLQVHHTIGNHDCLGVYPQSGMQPGDSIYGKRYDEDHVGKTYYSFDHKGVHFIVLNSIGLTPDRAYEGRVDATQVAWLAADLNTQPAAKLIILSVHIPLVSAIDNYTPVPATPLAPPRKQCRELLGGYPALHGAQHACGRPGAHAHQRMCGLAWGAASPAVPSRGTGGTAPGWVRRRVLR